MKNSEVKIVAGPCSIDTINIDEVHEIAEISVKNADGKIQKAIYGTRIVGVKSRTELSSNGKGMGIDFPALIQNMEILAKGGGIDDMIVPPSVNMAEQIVKKSNMLIATEVMMPSLQLPHYEGKIPHNKLMPWNPAVNQLGWQLWETVAFVKRNNWHVGIKNGKWVGEHLQVANHHEYMGATTMEKTWAGLTTFAGGMTGDIILIHRGVDVPDKGNYRNIPVHQIAKRAKLKSGAKLYFDPSHTYGPKLRDHIIHGTIDAMKMKINENEYLYEGALIEVGTSTTDTEQHITIKELKNLVEEINTFRTLANRI
ncbi:MAG: hypothetical protein WCO06_01275 [Candidatus Roizmanbacteria bacterium]